MKYIILTYAMYGVSGGPSYVNNKVKWLIEKGVVPVVFDHYGSLYLNEKIVLEYLKPYSDNRFLELFFPPSYFSKSQRKRIIDRLCVCIGPAEKYIVESHSSRLALWGELLAERLGAKHLVLNIGEHSQIKSKREYQFLNFKFVRNELFTIKPKTIQYMFKGFRDISDDEAQNHYFAAAMGVVPEDVPVPELDHMPEAKYTIMSFGRHKPYFDNMIDGVVSFAQKHKSEKIVFLIMGDVELPSKTISKFHTAPNMAVLFIPAKRPVPKLVFQISDLVIASAGCANLSYRQNAKTISMDVETNMPLGVMGYSTVDSVYSTDPNQPKYDLSELIEDVLVRHLYDGEYSLKKVPSDKGFDYQWGLINDDCQYWQDVDKIAVDQNMFMRWVQSLILRCGGVHLFVKD